jgi:chorismate mutase
LSELGHEITEIVSEITELDGQITDIVSESTEMGGQITEIVSESTDNGRISVNRVVRSLLRESNFL